MVSGKTGNEKFKRVEVEWPKIIASILYSTQMLRTSKFQIHPNTLDQISIGAVNVGFISRQLAQELCF